MNCSQTYPDSLQPSLAGCIVGIWGHRPAQSLESLAAFFFIAEALNQVAKVYIRSHMVTPKKAKKHPSKMTSDELVRHIFHPGIVKHVHAILEEHNSKPKAKKGRATTKP